jgi:cyclopropane-fatty-acyl-phospholipid synthase
MTAILTQNEFEQKASSLQKIGQFFFFKLLSKASKGKLALTLPNNEEYFFGDSAAPVSASLSVMNWNFFNRILWHGDIGFGESFVTEEWDSSSLTKVMYWFAINQNKMEDHNMAFSRLGELASRVVHLFNANTIKGSRKNISSHYDLSNKLYQTFLDEKMQYSCALWEDPEESLEEAQLNKMMAILNKLQLKPGMTILEIGSGWGNLAILAAEKFKVKVKSITLSEEQLQHAKSQALKKNLDTEVDFQLLDYRNETGKFDRVMSVEMIEAVGHENLGTYFKKIESVLKPNGIAVIQAITVPSHKYETYRKSCDWIQKYIFPGAVCPSLKSINDAITSNTKLMVHDLENIGIHYARTLKEWRLRFDKKWPYIETLEFDNTFKRLWEYYLCYCEGAYQARSLDNLQIVISPTNNEELKVYERSR